MHIGRVLLLIAVALLPHLAVAQARHNDYYLARSDQQLSQLLRTVEAYHLQPGIDKMRDKYYAAAWGDFNFLLAYFPNHPRGLVLMSELCQAWRNPKCRLEEYFDQAITVNVKAPGVYVAKGIYLQKNNRIKEAIDNYKKAVELDPDSLNAHYNLALAYVQQKQYTQANEHAQRAYALGAPPPGLHNMLVAAGAWKPLESKPVQDKAKANDVKDAVATENQPNGPATKSEVDKPAGAKVPDRDESQ